MWMMGYNDEGSDFNLSNSCSGRKLRPLVPRPTTAISTSNNGTSTPSPCLSRLHGTDVFSINHHISNVGEQGKREFNNQSSVLVSSRWNPTPEQLQTLEDLYRRGTRTPSAEQIQHITAQLRRYGKIEGKNVFYWFQNHKARERQKRRRQLTEESVDIEGLERREQGESRTVVFEVEQTKNWPPPTNCSTLPEESVLSIQRAAARAGRGGGGGGGAVAECRTDNIDGWVQFDKGELQHSRRHFEKNATWQMMQLSCPPPSCSTTHHLINSTTTSCSAAAAAAAATIATETVAIRSRMDPTTTDQDDLNYNNNTTTTTTTTNIETDQFHHLNNNFFTTPMISCNQKKKKNANYFNNNNNNNHDKECSSSSTRTIIGESHQTLQLFPLESLNEMKTGGGDDQTMSYSNSVFTTNDPPYQYFEFLPLKN